VFWCYSIDLKFLHKERVHLLFKFSFRVDFFLFSRLGVASLLCESSWAIVFIRLSEAIVVAPYWGLMQTLVLRINC
jgi:hypothetical protein